MSEITLKKYTASIAFTFRSVHWGVHECENNKPSSAATPQVKYVQAKARFGVEIRK